MFIHHILPHSGVSNGVGLVTVMEQMEQMIQTSLPFSESFFTTKLCFKFVYVFNNLMEHTKKLIYGKERFINNTIGCSSVIDNFGTEEK